VNPFAEALLKAGKPLWQSLKDCGKMSGFSEYYLRRLVTEKKVETMRIGTGKNARYFVNVASLLEYIENQV